jgi:hypothetical protein
MKTYIVQLEEHDDVISAQDKISWSKAQRVLLVWPRKYRVLERRIDLLLLQRFSQQHGAQMGIVTRNSEALANARELGIPVFKNTAQARKSAAWYRTRRAPHLADAERPKLDPASLRLQREALHSVPTENRWLRMAFAILMAAVLVALLAFFIPRAEIQIQPVQESQELTLNVWASPAVKAPSPSGRLPAHPMTAVVEGRDQVESTGQLQIPSQAAVGTVELTNLTDQAVLAPRGSLFLTTTQPVLQYRLTRDAALPAGAGESVQAPVEAVASGSGSNIPAGRILAVEGALGLKITVNNPQPVGGGMDRTVPAPTQADYQKLRKKLFADLQQSAKQEIQDRLATGEQLLEQTLQVRSVVEEIREPAAGQPGNQLQLTIRVEYEAWSVAEADLQQMANAALDASRKTGFRSVPASLEIDFSEPLKFPDAEPVFPEVTVETSPGAADSSPTAEATPAAPREETENRVARGVLHIRRMAQGQWSGDVLAEAIRGKTIPEAMEILQSHIQLAQKPQISIFPGFWNRLPYFPAQITWKVQ